MASATLGLQIRTKVPEESKRQKREGGDNAGMRGLSDAAANAACWDEKENVDPVTGVVLGYSTSSNRSTGDKTPGSATRRRPFGVVADSSTSTTQSDNRQPQDSKQAIPKKSAVTMADKENSKRRLVQTSSAKMLR